MSSRPERAAARLYASGSPLGTTTRPAPPSSSSIASAMPASSDSVRTTAS